VKATMEVKSGATTAVVATEQMGHSKTQTPALKAMKPYEW